MELWSRGEVLALLAFLVGLICAAAAIHAIPSPRWRTVWASVLTCLVVAAGIVALMSYRERTAEDAKTVAKRGSAPDAEPLQSITTSQSHTETEAVVPPPDAQPSSPARPRTTHATVVPSKQPVLSTSRTIRVEDFEVTVGDCRPDGTSLVCYVNALCLREPAEFDVWCAGKSDDYTSYIRVGARKFDAVEFRLLDDARITYSYPGNLAEGTCGGIVALSPGQRVRYSVSFANANVNQAIDELFIIGGPRFNGTRPAPEPLKFELIGLAR